MSLLGSPGTVTAVLHDKRHAEPLPATEFLTLYGHWSHELAGGFGTSVSGVRESVDQHEGTIFSPSLYDEA